MIEMARKVVVVADSSKFKKRGFAFIAPINKVHTLITDKGIPSAEKLKLEGIGVQVIIA
jgi:DeoR family transcriptional regulator of aga operon